MDCGRITGDVSGCICRRCWRNWDWWSSPRISGTTRSARSDPSEPAKLTLVPPNQLPRQIVGAAIVDSLASPALLLAARRTAPEQFAGMWEFPGGKVEAGESDTDALHRELLEELGVTVNLGTEVEGPVAGGWPLNESAVMRVWLAEVTSGEPQPLEDHDLLSWVPLDNTAELWDLAWIPADRPIVDAVLKHAHQAARR